MYKRQLRDGARERRLDVVAQAHHVRLKGKVLADAQWDAKLDGILSYPSQLETIFQHYVGVKATRDGIHNALATFAGEEHEENVGERFWKLMDAPISKGS